MGARRVLPWLFWALGAPPAAGGGAGVVQLRPCGEANATGRQNWTAGDGNGDGPRLGLAGADLWLALEPGSLGAAKPLVVLSRNRSAALNFEFLPAGRGQRGAEAWIRTTVSTPRRTRTHAACRWQRNSPLPHPPPPHPFASSHVPLACRAARTGSLEASAWTTSPALRTIRRASPPAVSSCMTQAISDLNLIFHARLPAERLRCGCRGGCDDMDGAETWVALGAEHWSTRNQPHWLVCGSTDDEQCLTAVAGPVSIQVDDLPAPTFNHRTRSGQ